MPGSGRQLSGEQPACEGCGTTTPRPHLSHADLGSLKLVMVRPYEMPEPFSVLLIAYQSIYQSII